MNQGTIYFFEEQINFRFSHKRRTRKWIKHCIESEHKRLKSVSYIFCNDQFLYEMNLKYLKHDTLTDILTFNYSDIPDDLTGDIFISIDRVRENSIAFYTGFQNELSRLLIHGILHLCAYSDVKTGEKVLMRKKEDYYLSLLPNF